MQICALGCATVSISLTADLCLCTFLVGDGRLQGVKGPHTGIFQIFFFYIYDSHNSPFLIKAFLLMYSMSHNCKCKQSSFSDN